MRRVLEADTTPSERLDIGRLQALGTPHAGKCDRRASA